MTRTLLLLAALAADPGAGDPAAPVDLASVLNEAQVVEAADTAAWAHLSFRRHTVRQDLGDNDEVLKAEEMVFRVTPKAGGFDEALVLLDGKTPEPQEVKKQRRLGRFAKHYRTLIRGDSEDSAEGGYSLGDLLHLSAYRYVGRSSSLAISPNTAWRGASPMPWAAASGSRWRGGTWPGPWRALCAPCRSPFRCRRSTTCRCPWRAPPSGEASGCRAASRSSRRPASSPSSSAGATSTPTRILRLVPRIESDAALHSCRGAKARTSEFATIATNREVQSGGSYPDPIRSHPALLWSMRG